MTNPVLAGTLCVVVVGMVVVGLLITLELALLLRTEDVVVGSLEVDMVGESFLPKLAACAEEIFERPVVSIPVLYEVLVVDGTLLRALEEDG